MRGMGKTCGAVLFLSAALAAGCAGPSRVRLAGDRPRLFIRPAEGQGAVSLEALRRRVKEPPFEERVHLLRGTIADLALKWLLTGDEEAAGRALQKMRRWNHPRPVTSEEGVQLIDLALGYDWLYNWNGFGEADRRAVEEKMVRLAMAMQEELAGPGAHVFHTRMYSWNAGLGMAGLALHDTRPEGRDLFLFAKDYYEKRLLPARNLQGGAFHNGFLYALNYTVFPTLQFLEAAKSAAGIDYFHTPDPADSRWLREVPFFLVYGTRPDLTTVKYADLTTNVPKKHFCFALDILAAEYRNGYAAELARRIRRKYKTSGYHAEWIYLFLVFHDPTVAPRPFDDLPTFRLFSRDGLGHAFFRSGWGPEAALVHFRCGDYFGDHGHFDQGGFTVFKGEPLALKSGFYDFSSPHRLHYYKQAISTNLVIFNDPADTADEGRQRNVRYQEANTVDDYLLRRFTAPFVETGNILAVDDPSRVEGAAPGMHSVAADVTPAWPRKKVLRHHRYLAFFGGRYLVVVDDTVTAAPRVRARWLLHTQVKPVLEGDVWAVRQGKVVLFVQPLLPEKPRVTLIGGAGRECEVNGVNYTYLAAPKYVRYFTPGPRAKLRPELGLWRMEVEYPRPAARRLFAVVLTPTEDYKPPAPAGASLDGDTLTVTVDGRPVRFHLAGR